jgi:hypothetical protein
MECELSQVIMNSLILFTEIFPAFIELLSRRCATFPLTGLHTEHAEVPAEMRLK